MDWTYRYLKNSVFRQMTVRHVLRFTTKKTVSFNWPIKIYPVTQLLLKSQRTVSLTLFFFYRWWWSHVATALPRSCSVPGHSIFLTFHFLVFGIRFYQSINRDFDPGSSLARTSLTSVNLRPWPSPKPVRFSSLTGEFQSSHWPNCCSRRSLIGQKSHHAQMLSLVELLYSPTPHWYEVALHKCSHWSNCCTRPIPHGSEVAPRTSVLIGRIGLLAPLLIGLKSHRVQVFSFVEIQ